MPNHLAGRNSLLRNHQLTIDPLRRITIPVLTPRLGEDQESQRTRFIPFAPAPYRLHNRLLVTPQGPHEAHSPHPLMEKEIPLRRHKASPTGHRVPISDTLQGIHVPERINYTSTPPQHTLKPSASSFSLEQLENKYVREGRDIDLPLGCAPFPLNPRFRERFWHLSKHFIALAGRPNDYLNIFFTRDTSPYKTYAKYDPFYLQFGFLHPTQMHVKNTDHKVNSVKMLHTMNNYLFVQNHFQHTNPIIHMNSRLQYAKTTLTSPFCMNYSYIMKPNFCKGTLRKFDPIKSILYSPHSTPKQIAPSLFQ